MILLHAVAIVLVNLAISVLAGSDQAQKFGPVPHIAPEDVVSVRPHAFENNDIPAPNAGLRQT